MSRPDAASETIARLLDDAQPQRAAAAEPERRKAEDERLWKEFLQRNMGRIDPPWGMTWTEKREAQSTPRP